LLKCIVVSTVPSFSSEGGCRPYVEITYNENEKNDKLIATTKNELN
jgi:hypothetical protein